ncbi:hypothetical protein AA0113_g4498 [Alternaria arborescens]|uniref:Uncharacterized protein n=1 Tax=Alternaria arborescens TaxID=156630 RepID=A0A4Q4SC85_9PLEO|nr:hypothetical protein AA0113_g4498 [Alternaria arborescens]
MASRYDALQTREDMNNPIRLQEDQDVASVQQYEYQDVSVASERSSVSIQQHEYQNFSVANENLVNAAQQHKNKDVRTTVVPARKAEIPGGRPATIVRRVGKWPCTLLVLSILGTAAFIIYITFLWFTASGNKNWKNIALSGWMTRSVAIAAVVLRASTTVQAGLASSMLAAIALESTTGVALQDLAPLSLMRASSAAPYALLAYPRLGRNGPTWVLLVWAAIISITTVLLQFTSTILLADVNAGYIPSDLSPYAYVLPDLLYRGSLAANWQSAPRPWPIFAEYTDNSSADGSLGYSDTGLTMRALLPFSDTQSRSFVNAYQGPAPVIDARTICIRPNITNTYVLVNNTYNYKIHGNISVPSDLLPTLLDATTLASFEPTHFACEPSRNFGRDYIQNKVAGQTSVWDLTVCDFGPSARAALTANFWKNFSSPVTPFLLINYTGYVDQQVQNNTKFPPLELANFNDTTPGLHYHHKNEWLDLKQDADALDWSDGNNFADTKLSFSLCLPTFHAYMFNISASSQAPLEEPMYFYDPERSQFRYDDIRRQLVPLPKLSLEKRNVISLHPQSWLLFDNMTNQEYPFGNIDTMITLTGSNQIFTPGQEHPTVHLMDDAIDLIPGADRNIGGLGLEILQEGGTPAEAMQSMLMSVVLAGYQSFVFTEVSNGTPNSTVALRGDFITAQVPGGNGRPATNPAGATRSYVIVMIATTIHSVAVFLIFMLFIKSTKNTLIWESWHTIAQSISAVTEPYLSQGNLATDSDIKKQMKTDGTSNQAVSVKTNESGARAGVGVVRQRVKSSRVQKDSQSDLLMEELRPVRSVRDVQRWNDRDTTNN